MEEKKYVSADELEAARLEVMRVGGKARAAAKLYGNLALGFFLGGCLLILIFGIANQGSSELNVPSIVIVSGMVVAFIVFGARNMKHHTEYMKYFNPYNEMYKTQFLPSILKDNFQEFYSFEPQNGLSKEIVIKSDIFPGFARIITNDYLRAKLDDVKFEFCDIELKSENRDGEQTTCFWGIFIVTEFDHFVDTPIYVISGAGMGNVTTESEIFNRYFSVHCEKSVDALRILTPQVMDNILKLKELCKKDIRIGFSDDKIYFNLNDWRNRFEIGNSMDKPIIEARKEIDEDILLIKKILELLNIRNLKSQSSQKQTTDEDFAGNAVFQDEIR
jgi:hypothetical protein